MNRFSWALCLVLTFAANGVFAESRQMSLEEIVSVQSVVSISASPDGQWLAYSKRVPRTPYQDDDGESWVELHVMNEAGQSRPFVTGSVAVSDIQWSNDSKTIYFLATKNDDEYKALYSISVDGGESQELLKLKVGIEAYSLNSAGDYLAYVAKDEPPEHIEKLVIKGFQAKVYEEDVHFNHAWLLRLKQKSAVAVKAKKLTKNKHISFIRFAPSGKSLLLMFAPTPLVDDGYMKKNLMVIDLGGKVKTHFKTIGKLSSHAEWSSDGKKIVFMAANDLNDPTDKALYVGSLDGSFKKVVENIYTHIMDVKISGEILYFIEHKGIESRVKMAQLDKLDTAEVLVDFNNGIQRALSVSDTGVVYACVDSAQHAPEVYRLSKGKSQRLTNSNPWFSELKLPKQEVFNYNARDGLDLEGILVYPLNYKKGKRYPMVALVHGGPESHNSNGWNTSYSWPIPKLAGEGYFSFIPNYRGSTGRGLAFSKLDQHAYADPEFTDILDGKLALVKKGLVDSKRVGISGGSYGGYATAWSATALSKHYAAGVMFVGISNQLSKFGTSDIAYEMYHVHSRAWPWDDYQWMLERSPIYHVKKARTPLLIIHGEADTRVHPSQSMELYRYLKILDQAPVRLVTYPGEPHGNKKAAAQLDYSMRFMRWMNFYLKDMQQGIPPFDLKHQAKLPDK